MKPVRVGGRNQAIVHIEEDDVVNHITPPPIWVPHAPGHATQYHTTFSTTTFKMVGDSGSPWVAPLKHLKSSPQYPPNQFTIIVL